MKYKTMLITGGAGFIGSNLALLFKRRYPRLKVISIDNLKRRGSELNLTRLKENGIDFLHADIRSPEDLVLDLKFDLLLECSAEPAVLAGYGQNPLYIINTNLTGTINCLELARRNKADVIFLSTSRVYPFSKINGLKRMELASRFDWAHASGIDGFSEHGISAGFTTSGPKTLYGATKLASELILEEYIDAYGLKGVINRCGVIAGPWQFGKVDQGIFTFWMLAHYFRRSLKYIGFRGKGKQVRDILHIEDLFELIDKQIAVLPRINGNIYNIGGGRKISLSLLELTALAREITGNHVAVGKDMETRPGDIAVYFTDNRKAEADLGWHPKKTSPQILEDIYFWIHSHEKELGRL